MTENKFSIRGFLATLFVALIITGCASNSLKASDPHLVGKRDMNYDHLIVPGERIGPVSFGERVSTVVQHLGEPDSVPYRNDDQGVKYRYESECISFGWRDKGIEPVVSDPNKENFSIFIIVTCDKWHTARGVHVGMPLKDAIDAEAGRYCTYTAENSSYVVAVFQNGLELFADNRNANISDIALRENREFPNDKCPSIGFK